MFCALIGALLLSTLCSCQEADIRPYEGATWGPTWSHEQIREMMAQRQEGVDSAHEKFHSLDVNSTDEGHAPVQEFVPPEQNASNPIYERFRYRRAGVSSRGCETIWGQQRGVPNNYWGNVVRVNDPLSHFSILPPARGCGVPPGATPGETSNGKCHVAMNAGFFNTHTFDCHGNLVSDGDLLQNPGIQNANFGITKNGTFVVGYLSKDDVKTYNFQQLIAGVGWLVRNGKPYLESSAIYENMTTQETGGEFNTVITARSALGHDAQGRILMVTIDGTTPDVGGNLYDMTDLMISLGAVNAINLDGGGSTAMFEDGKVIGQPSDWCDRPHLPENQFTCARRVTTMACVHGTHPSPPNPGHTQPNTTGPANSKLLRVLLDVPYVDFSNKKFVSELSKVASWPEDTFVLVSTSAREKYVKVDFRILAANATMALRNANHLIDLLKPLSGPNPPNHGEFVMLKMFEIGYAKNEQFQIFWMLVATVSLVVVVISTVVVVWRYFHVTGKGREWHTIDLMDEDSDDHSVFNEVHPSSNLSSARFSLLEESSDQVQSGAKGSQPTSLILQNAHTITSGL